MRIPQCLYRLMLISLVAGPSLGAVRAAEPSADTLKPDPHRTTLPIQWRERCEGAMRYYGFSSLWWGTPQERAARVAELRADGSNSQGCNFGWLSGMMTPTSDTLGARIDESQSIFREFPQVLTESERNGYPLFVGNISCTNFHEYPDWYVKSNPGLYVTTAKHSQTALQYERHVEANQQRGWSAIDNAKLNAIKREFVKVITRHFGSHPALKAWCMDGESLYPPNLPLNDIADYGPEAIRHYRAWLARKYGTIETLNTAWGARHADFAAIEPPREKLGDAPNVDWHRFRCEAMMEYVQQFYALYKSGAPQTPALVWQHDVQFRNFERLVTGQSIADYARVGDGIQANPIIRPPRLDYNVLYFRAMTSFNKPVISKEASYFPRPWPAENVRMQLFEMLGMGLWAAHLCEWEWHSEGIDWGIKGTPGEQAARQTYEFFKSQRGELAGMWPIMPTARVYISDAKWLMDGWLPEWNQLQLDLITSQQPNLYLFDWQLENPIYWSPLVISVANSVVDRRAAAALERYVRAGGTLALIDEFQQYDEKITTGSSTLGDLPDGEHPLGAGKVLRVRRPYSAAAFNLLRECMDFGGFTPWVRLTKTPMADRPGIELFPLTRQTSAAASEHAVVVVNTNNRPCAVALEFDPLLLGDGTYRVRVAQPGKTTATEAGSVNSKQLTLVNSFTVPAHGGTVVFLSRPDSESTSAPTGRSLTLDLRPGPDQRWNLKLTTHDGMPADAVIDARVVPLFDAPVKAERIAPGQYRLVPPRPLPTVYDYDAGQYRPFVGPVELQVYAYSAAGEGYTAAQVSSVESQR